MQTRSLYIASLQKNSGSFSIALGLMELLVQNYQNVGIFEPVISSARDSAQLIDIFSLSQNPDEAYCFESRQFLKQIAADEKQAYAAVIEKYEMLRDTYDFILILGINRDLISSVLDYDINFSVANHIGAPFAAVLSGKDKEAEAIESEMRFEKRRIEKSGCELFAFFVNMVSPQILRKLPKEPKSYYLPFKQRLSMLSVSEIQSALEAKQMYGRTSGLKRLVAKARVVSSHPGTFLRESEEGEFVITAADRGDIVLAVLAVLGSANMPLPSGVLLCGKLDISDYDRLIASHEDLALPILHTDISTYHAAAALENLSPSLNAKTKNKLAIAQGVFFDYVDSLGLQKRLLEAKSDVLTPLMFTHRIVTAAKRINTDIVLPESGDERILRAAELLAHKKICAVTLIGSADTIQNDARSLGLDMKKVRIIDHAAYEKIDVLTQMVYEKRKHKGMSRAEAREWLENDVSAFAAALVQCGICDGMVSGAAHTTAQTIRPALQLIGTREETGIVSSIFFIALETKVLVYGDCAINKDPSARELAQIAISSAASAKAFGLDPQIAMLSYSSGDSGSGAVVQKVKEATALVRQLAPHLPVEGPIQYDAAVDETVAHKKLPESRVAGHANVFIFPDLNSGNNTYKAVQRSSDAVAMGPVLQGLNKSVNDLSRGCSVDDIVSTAAITAVQAGSKRQK